jgi:hypothetical protein
VIAPRVPSVMKEAPRIVQLVLLATCSPRMGLQVVLFVRRDHSHPWVPSVATNVEKVKSLLPVANPLVRPVLQEPMP